MNCSSNNGRVDIMEPTIETQFSMQDKIPINKCSSFRDAMTGNWYDTVLSTTFFSAQNIQLLQNNIRAGVFNMSNGKFTIGLQDCDTLKIIMRSIFLQYAQNQNTDIQQQIANLNQLVLDYAVPQVHGEAEGYIIYKKDVSTMYVPIAHPICGNGNDKTLELKHFF
jgi:hypothetical protein